MPKINYAVLFGMLHWMSQVFINFTATNKKEYATISKIHMADRHYPESRKDFFKGVFLAEVISPASLRKTMKGWVSDMYNLYKND